MKYGQWNLDDNLGSPWTVTSDPPKPHIEGKTVNPYVW
jgi:hypothetical protein